MALKRLSLADKLGLAAITTGVILVVTGAVLQGRYAVDFGAAIRTLGGVQLSCGLLAVAVWEPRRRAAVIGRLRGIATAYLGRTAAWRWSDRVGLAGLALGAGLLVPAVAVQAVFGAGAVVMFPAAMLFWGGVALLVYGRFYRARGASSSPRADDPPRSGGHGRRGGIGRP